MRSAPREAKFSASESNWLPLLAIAAIGSLISIVTTGFAVGVRNDVYYLPIVNALYDEAQFANDSFIQSLRYFSAGPWMLLSGIAKHIDTYWLLLALDFMSRLLAFLGFLACASHLGVKKWPQAAFLTVLLCTTSFLRGQSLAGDGGLFINYFTHSEIANGLTLLILLLLLRGWLMTAIAANGLVFFINAFIGVWDAAMIAAITMAMALKGETSWRNVLLKGSIGAGLAAVLAAPVIRNILINPDFGAPLTFDYVTYLEEFWPYHFIFSDISIHEKLGLAAMVALGIAAFIALGRSAHLFIVAIAAFSAIYVIGIVVPHVTHSALILNLHSLRVSTMLQLLVVLGSLVLATEWWFSDDPVRKFVFSPLLILLLCTPIKMTTIQPAINSTMAVLVIAASFCPSVREQISRWLPRGRPSLNYLAVALVAVGFLATVTRNMIGNSRANAWIAEWTTIGNWAKSSTSPNDVFLIQTWNFRGSPSGPPPGSDVDEAILNSGAFESAAHRSVWVDFRNGAAVLWSPSYYGEWHERVTEVNALTSFAARNAYARANGIRYIADVCASDTTQPSVYSTKRLCVYDTSGRDDPP
jgi:hypothetical protein